MVSKSDFFLKKALGEDFLESLAKVELWKPDTKTTVDHEELKTALQIVPRTIMSLLIRELTPMEVGENKEIDLPVEGGAILRVTKHAKDVYGGDIIQSPKVPQQTVRYQPIVDFKYRAIPGVGLVIMSAFELYDVNRLAENHAAIASPAVPEDIGLRVQRLIDERLALHDLVHKVVDKKIEQKEAINQLLLAKLNFEINNARATEDFENERIKEPSIEEKDRHEEAIELPKKIKKPLKLKTFIEDRKKKLKKSEYSIELAKGEIVDCPDCGKNIFNGTGFSGCICFGQDMNHKVFIKKTEDGIKLSFGKNWDVENVEMLLDILRRKNG